MANKTGKGGFQKGADPRRHTSGTKSAAAVAFTRTLREMLVAEGERTQARKGETKSNAEWLVQSVWREAIGGQSWAVNFIAERVEGKVPQQNEITGKDGKDFTVILKEIVKRDDANS